MKKLLSILLALTFVLTLTACGTQPTDEMSAGDDTNMEDTMDNETTMEDEMTEEAN